MFGALIYLRVMSFRNWVLWRLRRLRQPKYLIGAIVGVAYFYFFFFRRVGAGRGSRHAYQAVNASAASLPADWLPIALAVGTLVLLVVLACAWIVPTQRAALGFSEAEIAFLFPAPVKRRALVHFRLLSAQFRSLGAGLLMSLVSNRWTLTGGTALTLALGWWLIFSTLNLHYTGASFTLTRLSDRGVNVWTRRGLALGALALVFGVALWRLPAEVRLPATGGSGVAALGEWILAVSSTAPLSWLLYPLRLVLGPFFAGELRVFALALGPALAVIALHYLWVVRSVTTFEDASIQQAERRAARIAAWKSGEGRRRTAVRGRAAPFSLHGAGRPEFAFLWKNLLSTSPYFSVRVFGITAGVIVVASAYARTHAPLAAFAAGATWVFALLAAYLLVLGPQFARQDIRSDMRNIDVLKTYPLAGWQVVLGEILTPTAILTGFVWLAVLIVVLNADAHGPLSWFTPGFRVAAGVAAVAMIPPIVTLQLLVPNAAALIFPAWFEAARTRGGGPEVMGQRMIFLFAQLVMIVLMLLPAAIMGVFVAWIAQFLVPLPVAVLIAVLPVTAVLVAEVAGGLWWLGRRFEKIDVAEELRA